MARGLDTGPIRREPGPPAPIRVPPLVVDPGLIGSGGIVATIVPRTPPTPTPPITPVPPAPAPAPAPRSITRPVFDIAEAANDPKFSIAGRILTRGLGVIGAAFATRDILRMIEDELSEREAIEQQAKIDSILRVRERERGFLDDLQTIPLPEPELFPESVPIPVPARVPVPAPDIEFAPALPEEIPVQVPEVSPEIDIPTPTLPAPSPQTTPSTTPRPRRTPGSRPLPRGLPLPTPSGFPIFQPIFFPRAIPAGVPATNPINVTPPGLTPFSPPVPQSPPGVGTITTIQPQRAPQAQQQRCQDVRRRRRRKGKCREGFFKEFPGRTRFITWREVDCATRRETRGLSDVRFGLGI